MDWRKLCSATRSCGGGDVAAEGGEARESGGALLAGRGELFHFFVRAKGTRRQAGISRAQQTPGQRQHTVLSFAKIARAIRFFF